jgi:acyl-CoA thioesterase-1
MQNNKHALYVSVLALIGTGMLSIHTATAKTVMVYGDSISAGYGLNPEQGWVHLLQKRLEQQYPKNTTWSMPVSAVKPLQAGWHVFHWR